MAEDKMIYCVKCKKKTPTFNLTPGVSRNGRNMIQGNCVACGTKKTQFTK